MTAHLDFMAARNKAIGMPVTPLVEIQVEPYDGTEGMVRCENCRHQGMPRFESGRRLGCSNYVPSMRLTMQHCNRFRRKP